MFNSKFYFVMILLTFAAAAAGLALQILEMNQYELFATLFAGK